MWWALKRPVEPLDEGRGADAAQRVAREWQESAFGGGAIRGVLGDLLVCPGEEGGHARLGRVFDVRREEGARYGRVQGDVVGGVRGGVELEVDLLVRVGGGEELSDHLAVVEREN